LSLKGKGMREKLCARGGKGGWLYQSIIKKPGKKGRARRKHGCPKTSSERKSGPGYQGITGHPGFKKVAEGMQLKERLSIREKTRCAQGVSRRLAG